MTTRACSARRPDGGPCGSPPLLDGTYCLWHDPAHAEEVAEGRRLGGQRRRRERVLSTAYAIEGLATVQQIRRLVEVAIVDTLGLENSVSRNRTLAYLAMVALKTLEVGEFETRLLALEAAVGPGRLAERSVFDAEPEEGAFMFVEEATDGNQEEPVG